MDALSSSSVIFSTFPNLSLKPPPSSSNFNPPLLLNISSARTEPPPTSTAAGRTSPKNQNPPAPPAPAPPSLLLARRRVGAAIFDAIDDFVNKFIDPPLRPWVDAKYVLSDNFAPVNELPPTECEVVEGFLPPCVDGAYIRNGPNPQFLPRGPYHLFDGDGMLHAVRISKGRATLCSRYVKTYKYTVELEAGSPVFPNAFASFQSLTSLAVRGALAAARALTGQYNPVNGFGVANTGLSLIGPNLYALYESDLPYAVKISPDGDILTLGRDDFDGKLSPCMTAHPKIDPETGETFAFRYGPRQPFLTLFRFSGDGTKQPDLPIFSMERPSMIHDFAITKKYAIFTDVQIGLNSLETIIGGGSLLGSDPEKVTRIGVIPRYSQDESEMRWFEVPGFNIMHAINAWEEEEEDGGETVVMVAPNILPPVKEVLESVDLVQATVEEVRMDMKAGTVSRQQIAMGNLDFAVINHNYVGKKNRYVYAGIGDPFPKISGIVKLDISSAAEEGDRRRDCTVASRMFGPGWFAGEPFYIAKNPNNLDKCKDKEEEEEEEDNGYVVTYVHNEKTGESRFMVMDAKSPYLDIVAAVKLPHRVPYGFHGLFLRESDFLKMG